jgi:hypothetical protein
VITSAYLPLPTTTNQSNRELPMSPSTCSSLMSRLVALILCCGLALLAGTARAGELPFTTAWTAVPNLNAYASSFPSSSFQFHGRLADGRLIFRAAKPGSITRHILLFNPADNSWQWKAPLPVVDYGGYFKPTAVLPLSSGRCLVTGWPTGSNTYNPLPMKTYIYDPDTDVFTPKADMTLSYTSVSGNSSIWLSSGYMTELPTGEILIGGEDSLIYNPATNAWRYGPSVLSLGKRSDQVCRLGLGGLWFQNSLSVNFVSQYGVGRFDAGTMQWRSTVALTPSLPPFSSSAQVDAEVFAFGTRNLASPPEIWKYDLGTDACTFLENVPNAPVATRHQIFTINAAGRSWLGMTYTATDSNDFGYFDVRIRDAISGTWTNTTRCPVRLVNWSPSMSDNLTMTIPTTNGVLLLGYSKDGVVKAQLLRVTSSGGSSSPAVDAAALPAALNLDEGTMTTLTYRVVGDIPIGGVEVVVERLSGDGDARVVDGATQRVLSRAETKTVRIAALTDADAANDQAVIRLRVVQSGGGADPNARTLPVTVRDLYRQTTHMPGDVNGDGVVDAADLDEVVSNFGKTAGGD